MPAARTKRINMGDADHVIEWDAVTRDLREHIDSYPFAKRALAVLLKAGCEENVVLRCLYSYCGGDPDTAKAIKKEFGRRKKQMTRLSEDLAHLAGQIAHATLALKDLGITCHFTPDAEGMCLYAEFLA